MLRITHTAAEDSVSTLKLEGKLLGLWVDELARSCDELPGSTDRVRLDLAAVTFVDEPGMALLRRLLESGVRLAGCSRLVAELLHLEVR